MNKKKLNFENEVTKTTALRFYDFSRPQRFSLLCAGMGKGKTAITVSTVGEYAKRDFGGKLDVVVIAPKKVLEENSWVSAFAQYNDDYGTDINVVATFNPTSVVNAHKNGKKKKKDIEQDIYDKKVARARKMQETTMMNIEECIAFIDDEAISKYAEEHDISDRGTAEKKYHSYEYEQERRKVKERSLDGLFKHMQENPTIVVVDEVHMFKTPKGMRSKALLSLINVACKTLSLTATPAPNSQLEYVTYLIYAGYYTSYTNFVNTQVLPQYRVRQIRGGEELLVFQNDQKTFAPDRFYDFEKLDKQIKSTIIVPDIKTTFSIPEKEQHIIRYDLEKSSQKEYVDCKKKLANREYDSFPEYRAESKRIIDKDMNHLRMLASVLIGRKKQGLETIQPLIFYLHTSELGDDPKKADPNSEDFSKGILWALDKLGYDYATLNGQSGLADVDKDNLNQAVVIQYQSGGAGIEFPKSNCTIFYGLTYSWQDFTQASGRNVRRGEDHHVDQYVLISNNTMDKFVFEALESKKNMTISDERRLLEYELGVSLK